LRTLNSKHEIEIVNFEEKNRWEGNAWYYLEIGVKPE
jgi:hypothetical protein